MIRLFSILSTRTLLQIILILSATLTLKLAQQGFDLTLLAQ